MLKESREEVRAQAFTLRWFERRNGQVRVHLALVECVKVVLRSWWISRECLSVESGCNVRDWTQIATCLNC